MKFVKLLSILSFLLAFSCLRDPEVERNEPDVPTVSCDENSKTRVSFIISGHVKKIIPNATYGLIIEAEDGSLQERSFRDQDLSIDNNFQWRIEGLTPGSSYLVRSYISNGHGRKCSESILVSTPKTSIATLSLVTFDKESGLLQATIIDDGGRDQEDYGFSYGSSPDIKELKKEKRHSGVLKGKEISLPISDLKVEQSSNFIAYSADSEGYVAYSPNCLPLSLTDIYNLEFAPENGESTIKIGSSIRMVPTITPHVDLPLIWSSTNETVATVDKDGVVTGLSKGSCNIKASCGMLEATHAIVVEPIPVASVSLAPATLSLTEGQSTQLIATVLPENATDQTISWSSSNESVATVDQHGLVQALSVGAASITAKTGEQSATCEVTVNKLVIPVTSVSLSQPFLALEEGQTATLVATVLPENATDKTVTWTSSNTAIASVSQDGLVSAIAPGSATITAKAGDITATCLVSISAAVIPVTSVSLNYDTLALEEGQTATLVATVSPDNATDKTVTWSSSNTTIASVSQDGLVSAIAPGSATITAKAGNITATCLVSISAAVIPVTSVSLNYDTLSLEEGQSATLVATVFPENATDKTVAWSSSNKAIASVSQDGLVSAIAPGSAAITAKAGNITATCLVSISAAVIPVTSVSINYDTLSLEEGQSATLVATVSPENATDKTVTWSSSNSSVASVSQDGLVSALSSGSATITVKAGDKTATCQVTVSDVVINVTSISLNRATATLRIGQTTTLVATVQPENATDNNITWSSSNNAIASVSQDGVVSAIAIGACTVYASCGGKQANCQIAVISSDEIPVALVSFDESEREVYVGEIFTLSPTIIPSNATNPQLEWTSSNTAIANVDSEGLITPVGIGECTITATAKSGTPASFVCIVISEAPFFPDDNFRYYVYKNHDLNGDGFLSRQEVKQTIQIALGANTSDSSLVCESLKGLEFFDNLEYLHCESIQLTSLDVSKNVKLKRLNCYNNQLTSLNVSNNPELVELYCPMNKLTNLDISNNRKLARLDCYINPLINLDVSNNIQLKVLNCYYNQLSYLDVSNNTKLEALECNSNYLTSLDVRNNPELQYLKCLSNQITSLDIRNNLYLKTLDCRLNPITDIWLIQGQEISLYYPSTATLHYE